MKLYFMMGLPTETDEDVVGIPHCAMKVMETGHDLLGPRAKISASLSVAVFVPKAHTPFQWAGQLPLAETRRRQQLMLSEPRDPNIKISYHGAETSLLEGALSKMGRAGFEVIMGAWRRGCRFDAWTDNFDFEAWCDAARDCGFELADVATESFDLDARLPWDHTSPGVSKGFLQREWRRAVEGKTTADCTFESCVGCGVCQTLDVENRLAGVRS
jgi:hypothetical protein